MRSDGGFRSVDHRRLLNECPTVVGMMTSSLESGGSLDVAVRMVAAEGPKLSRRLFSEVVRTMDTKGSASMSKCLTDVMSDLPASAAGYRRALHMCMAASESGTDEERGRMLKDASDIALEAVKEMGDAYSATLNTPCMIVFGIGIMVPMILMSILPMLSVGGMMSVGDVDQDMISMITLVVIPASIIILSLSLRTKNPFLTTRFETRDLLKAAPLLIAIPMGFFYLGLDRGTDALLLFSLAPAAIVTVVLMWKDMADDKKRLRCEQGLRDSVFDMGNRILSGENFETASTDAIGTRAECSKVREEFSRELALCRGNVEAAINRSIRPVSEERSIAYVDIHGCSLRNANDAGKLAISLGRQFQNQNHTRKKLELRLKGMTDMMLATAMLFAPLVLGMSISMLGPIQEIADFEAMGDTTTILTVYLVELSASISVLMASLGSGEGFCKMLWRFCTMSPIALIVFCVCCGVVI